MFTTAMTETDHTVKMLKVKNFFYLVAKKSNLHFFNLKSEHLADLKIKHLQDIKD